MFLISLDRLISVLFPLWFVIFTKNFFFPPFPVGVNPPSPPLQAVVETKGHPSNSMFG
ncbi:unnamed protein product [Meloidogyne enterolobii]|uniref:Uncharacterized protein n=1 Tax=Meloidogyne enterolobii TaxID=390850 RepID=A0ACB0ZKJ0_MELEN